MFPNALASEQIAVVGVVDPAQATVAAHATGYIDMAKWEEVLAILSVGALGASATVDMKVTEYTTSGGAGSHDISGKAITQLTQAGTDDNKQVAINVRREDLNIDGGCRYIKVTFTVGTAASYANLLVVGLVPRRAPASDNNLSSVDEVIS